MSKRKKFFLVFCFIILNAFLLISFFAVREATMLNVLKKEVNELSNLDVTKDRYNTKIKSRGNYAVVEKAIKSYLDDYAVLLQDTLSVVNDSQLTNVLSYDNYTNDGPDFKQSLYYLDNVQSDFNNNVDLLTDMMDEKNINNYIKEKIDDPYYIAIFKSLMTNGKIKKDFSKTKKIIFKIKNNVNNAIDTSDDILNFLVTNKGNWITSEGEIRFTNDDLYSKYNNFVAKVKK